MGDQKKVTQGGFPQDHYLLKSCFFFNTTHQKGIPKKAHLLKIKKKMNISVIEVPSQETPCQGIRASGPQGGVGSIQ